MSKKQAQHETQLLAMQLQKSCLFSDFSLEEIGEHILPWGQICEFAKKEAILTPQARADRLGILLSGTVDIVNLFSDGIYSLMNTLHAPKVLGADLICTKSRRPPYYAICATPTQAIFFARELFLEQGLLKEQDRCAILNQLLLLISQENMQKYYRMAILSQKGLRARVLTYLSMQAQRRNTSTFEIPFSRDRLAAFLCVNRSALSHELSLMRQEGLIDFHKSTFTLLPLGEANSAWWILRPGQEEAPPHGRTSPLV